MDSTQKIECACCKSGEGGAFCLLCDGEGVTSREASALYALLRVGNSDLAAVKILMSINREFVHPNWRRFVQHWSL